MPELPGLGKPNNRRQRYSRKTALLVSFQHGSRWCLQGGIKLTAYQQTQPLGQLGLFWAWVPKLQDNYGICKYWYSFSVLKALWPISSHASLIPLFDGEIEIQRVWWFAYDHQTIICRMKKPPHAAPVDSPTSTLHVGYLVTWQMHTYGQNAHTDALLHPYPTTTRTHDSKHCPSLAPSTHLTRICQHYAGHQW